MLFRSFYHPAVAELIPETLDALEDWTPGGPAPRPAMISMARELKGLANQRLSGRLAEELNRLMPGASSMVKSTARKLRRADDAELAQHGDAMLLAANKKWADDRTWRAVRRSGKVFTEAYYLAALDLERGPDGGIQGRSSAKIYRQALHQDPAHRLHHHGLDAHSGLPARLLSRQRAEQDGETS